MATPSVISPKKELMIYLSQCDTARDNLGMIVASVRLWSFLTRRGVVVRFGRGTYDAVIYYKKVMFIYAPEYIEEVIAAFDRKMLIHVLNDIISRKGE